VDARAPFDKGQLVAQRRAPKVPAGDFLDLRWDSITKIVPAGLRNVLVYLGSVARASAM
jgi:hypothetical protein